MVKAVLFDFDGVLTKDADDKISLVKIFKRETKLSENELLTTIKKHISAPLYYGKIDFMICWKALCKELKVSTELLKEYIETTPIDTDVVELAKNFKNSGLQIGILTANSSLRMKMIADYFQLDTVFDYIFVSANEGFTKWEKEFFDIAVKKLKVSPEEIIFIDNSKRNLVEPKKMGIKTIFYTYSKESNKQLIAELRKLSVLE